MALIECPVCGKRIADRARVCLGCGTAMEEINRIIEEMNKAPKILVCPECGTEFEETEEVCPECGLPAEFINIDSDMEEVYCPICGVEYSSDEMQCRECGYPKFTMIADLAKLRKVTDKQRIDFYIGKLMAECNVVKREELALCEEPFDSLQVYTKIMNYGDESIKAEIKGYLDCINGREEKDRIYTSAKDKMEEGEKSSYEEAIRLFRSISEWKDADALMKNCQMKLGELETLSLNNIKKGDIIKFGRYAQGHGKVPLEWLVLDKRKNKLLVVSKYALDCKKYNEKYDAVSWEKCTLRGWLNNEFLRKAFNSEEQTAIATKLCTADKNPNFSTDPGNNTKDKVFLLSINEAEKYFKSAKDRMCVPTDYAKDKGVWSSSSFTAGTCRWWLRSPGNGQDYASYVDFDGSVGYRGRRVGDDFRAVRPALWINLES